MEMPKEGECDFNAEDAIGDAVGSLVSVLVLHAFRNKPLSEFLFMLDGFMGCGNDNFCSLALRTSLTVIVKDLAPIVLRGHKLQENPKKAYLERYERERGGVENNAVVAHS